MIAPDGGGSDLFAHRWSLLVTGSAIVPGDRVEFEIQEGGMGAQAVDVRPFAG